MFFSQVWKKAATADFLWRYSFSWLCSAPVGTSLCAIGRRDMGKKQVDSDGRALHFFYPAHRHIVCAAETRIVWNLEIRGHAY